MPRLHLLFAATAILALIATASAEEKDKFAPTKEEQEVLDLTNKERKDAGLVPLKANEKLFKAARDHSANMAKKNELNHTLDGKGPGERLQDLGYANRGWAENCAFGQQSPADALKSWMNSEGHKANILSQHAHIGIGIAANAEGRKYWTQVFANPGK